MEDEDDVASKETTSIPRAAIEKIIREQLLQGCKFSPDAPLLLQSVLREFVQMLATQANERATAQNKNTVSEAHATDALEELGFKHLADARETGSEATISEPKPAGRKKGKKRAQPSGMSEEELLRAQQELFASARQAMQQG